MSREHPSDLMGIPIKERGETKMLEVGEARDFLSSPSAVLHPFRLLKIAKGLSGLLHKEVDFYGGLEVLLPEETERRQRSSEEFLQRPEITFPAEERAAS